MIDFDPATAIHRPDVRSYLMPIEMDCHMTRRSAHVEFDFFEGRALRCRLQVVVDDRGRSKAERHLMPIGNTKRFRIDL